MIRLLDDALLSTRAGAGGLSQEMIELATLLATEVHDRRAQGAPVDLVGDERTRTDVVLGDRLALRRIFANIVDNALAYGHAAHVRMFVRDDAIVVSIDDDGQGIPANERKTCWSRFIGWRSPATARPAVSASVSPWSATWSRPMAARSRSQRPPAGARGSMWRCRCFSRGKSQAATTAGIGSAVTDLIFSIAKREVTFFSGTALISFL